MCNVVVIIFFPVFVISNGFVLPMVLMDNIFSDNLVINFGEIWVFLLILQLVNSIYGLILVCAKSKIKCILISWACQSVFINILFFFWTILFSQENSNSFEAEEAITFAFMETFSICTLYVVFDYYCEFVEKLSWEHISFPFA